MRSLQTRLIRRHSGPCLIRLSWKRMSKEDTSASIRTWASWVLWLTSMDTQWKVPRILCFGKLSSVTFTIQPNLLSISTWCALRRSGCARLVLSYYCLTALMEQDQSTRLVTWRDSCRISTRKPMTLWMVNLIILPVRTSTSKLLSAQLHLTTSTYCVAKCFATTASH